MSKKKCFDDVIRLFKGYEETKKRLEAEYKSIEERGMYSRQYLRDIACNNDKALREEHSRIISRLGDIREKYSKALDAEFDLTATRPDTGLQALVNSGITPTKEEFINLAQKYKGNYVNSRLLHDFAEKNGYILRNIATREEMELAFNNFTDHVVHSLYTQSIPVYVDSEIAKIKADSMLNKLENPVMDCYKNPETFEEAICTTVMMENADKKQTSMEIDDEAFLRGFWGDDRRVKAPEENPELMDRIKALTPEEKADAKWMSLYFGHKGEITQVEIDYLNSEDYKKYVGENGNIKTAQQIISMCENYEKSTAKGALDEQKEE